MSFLDRIRECNTHDLARFMPFMVAGIRVGWVKKPFAARLRAYPNVFAVSESAVGLAPGLGTTEARTEAVDRVVRELAAAGVIRAWREEPYPVAPAFGAKPLLLMERAAVPFFGVRAYGIHVNGFVRGGDGLKLWVGRRAPDKPTFPNELDNLIAGGQPAGMSLLDNLVKESEEEAAVPPELALEAIPVGAVSYCMETAEGLKPDVLFLYDLALSPDFEPENRDGEIAEFMLRPVEEVMDIVSETTQFKFNCALVNIDFFVRHGLIAPDEPDYLEIVQGLRR